MKNSKKLVFSTLFVGILVVFPTSFASADSGRYFVKSTKSFWKNALGVRQSFENGFTTELSDFQVRLNKIMGLQIEQVKVYQILENSDSTATLVKPTATPSISPSSTPDKTDKSQKDIRVVPSDQTPWGIEAVYDNTGILSTSGGKGTVVAVLDTGVNIGHPDIKGRVGQCIDFTNLKYAVQDNKCEDKNGHGTNIAGVIAADGGEDGLGIYGVAPEAKLFIYKVCDNNGSCYADDIAAAIRLAAAEGANVINMSFGGDINSGLVNDAINFAVSKKVLLVAAAGNDGPFNTSVDYPATLDSVIAVGALNKTLDVVEWSSRGTNLSSKPSVIEKGDIEFAAPGENIESTSKDGDYTVFSGTSIAAPFVSGLAAKFWQADEKNPSAAIRDYLKSLAVDIAPKGEDNMSGYGLPQVPFPPQEDVVSEPILTE